MYGVPMKMLVVEDGDEPTRCENCMKDMWTHPDLVRIVDDDWCLNCNDEAMGLDETSYQLWCLRMAAEGKIIFVGRQGE